MAFELALRNLGLMTSRSPDGRLRARTTSCKFLRCLKDSDIQCGPPNASTSRGGAHPPTTCRAARTRAPDAPTSRSSMPGTVGKNATVHPTATGEPLPPGRTSINHGPRYPNNCGRPARLDYGHLGIRLIPMQAKASTPGHPTGRNDPTAGGVPRKLAGRSPGVAIRHPSGTLLCLHVSKSGSDGLELTPLLPLDATRSSPCRRLGYIVTKRLAMTAST